MGIIGAFKFSYILEGYFERYIELSPKIIQIISFILFFLLIIYLISLLAKMITKTLNLIALGLLNRIAGGVFGFLKWSIILSTIILIIQEINEIILFIPESPIKESKIYPYFRELAIWLFDMIMQPESLEGNYFI